MGQVEHQERDAPQPDILLASQESEPANTRLAVLTVPRAALAAAERAPQVGDLLVVDIGGVDRAVIVFQLTSESAVVVDVT